MRAVVAVAAAATLLLQPEVLAAAEPVGLQLRPALARLELPTQEVAAVAQDLAVFLLPL